MWWDMGDPLPELFPLIDRSGDDNSSGLVTEFESLEFVAGSNRLFSRFFQIFFFASF